MTQSLLSLTGIIVGSVIVSTVLAEEPVDYNRDIQPILSKKCFACHGPADQDSGLALHQRESATSEADSGEIAIVPGKPEASELLRRILSADADERMPPEEEPLSTEEINLLQTWIKQDAPYAQHWSFVKPVAETPPEVAHSEKVQNEVDRFILTKLEEQGIEPSEEASRATLLRRLSLDLVGLLPTTTELDAFLQDESDNAYEKVVDRLLASEHFGERWGRHWLDLARYADTFGYERDDVRPNAWRYRDWVVNSFNNNQPYDQFVIEQLAGDLLQEPTLAQKVATGLHRMNIKNMESGINKEDYRNREMVDRLNTTGTAFLGLTLNCCQCHSHKYDPISQKEYYELYAFFNNIKPVNEDIQGTEEEEARYQEALAEYNQKRALLLLRQKTLQTLSSQGSLEKWNAAVQTQNAELQKLADWLESAIKSTPENWIEGLTLEQSKTLDLPKTIHKALAVEPEKRTEEHRKNITKEYKELPKHLERFKKNIRSPEERIASLSVDQETQTALLKSESKLSEQELTNVTQFRNSIPSRKDDTAKALKQQSVEKRHLPKAQIMMLAENQEDRRDTYFLARGDFKQKTEQVFAATPAVLNSLIPRNETPDRLDLANWLVSQDNPLTARVAVNHIWKHLFGTGIVSTMDDFGTQGSPPSHPELLDWLAAEFVKPTVSSGEPWSMKSMIRLMVMSNAFRQSSQPRERGIEVDAGTTLLWRFPPKRVEAEVIRDSVLQASGSLDRTIGGRSYRIHNEKKTYAQWQVVDNYGPETWRRMLYQERMRRVDDQIFTAFDFPDCGQVRARRPVSTTPLQALNLMNSAFVIDQSSRIADRALKEAGGDETAAIGRCFELLLGRPPEADELKACVQIARQEDLALVCRTLINTNEFAFLP